MDPVPVQRWRLVVRRTEAAPTLTQRDAMAAWEEAIRSSGLPVVMVDAEARRPRLTFGAPAGGTLASRGDLVDLWLTRRLPVADVRSAIARSLPEGHDLVGIHDVWLGEPALPGRVVASDLEAELRTDASLDDLRAAAASMLTAATLPRERTKGDRTVAYDLRPFLLDLRIDGGSDARGSVALMRLAHDPERGVGRPDEVLAELGDHVGRPVEAEQLVRLRLLLAEDLDPGRGRPREAAGRQGTGAPARRGPRPPRPR